MIIGRVHISYDKNKPENEWFVTIYDVVLDGLYEDVVPKLAERLGQDYADEAMVNYEIFEHVDFDDLDSENFNYAYGLVMEACDKHKFLRKHKDEFDRLFRSDKRFKV